MPETLTYIAGPVHTHWCVQPLPKYPGRLLAHFVADVAAWGIMDVWIQYLTTEFVFPVCHDHPQNSTIFTGEQSSEIKSWWRHQMETFPFRVISPTFVRGIHLSLVNFPHNCKWRGALIFSLICAWINGWLNNRETGYFKTPSCSLLRHSNVTSIRIAYSKIANKNMQW